MAAGTERDRHDRAHRSERQRPIEVGKQLAAARLFPLQAVGEEIGIDRDQQQIGFAAEMLGGGLARLGRGRKMDEAVGEIDRRTGKDAGRLGFLPERGGGELIDRDARRTSLRGRQPSGVSQSITKRPASSRSFAHPQG